MSFQSELFQDDIYPETASDVPAISGEDWFNGSSADPVLVGKLRDGNTFIFVKIFGEND